MTIDFVHCASHLGDTLSVWEILLGKSIQLAWTNLAVVLDIHASSLKLTFFGYHSVKLLFVDDN